MLFVGTQRLKFSDKRSYVLGGYIVVVLTSDVL